MTKLTDIFQSKAQVKLVEYMLENPQKVFNQSTLAQFLDCSPSTVARVIEPLVREKIVLFERFERGMKVLAINEESEKTKLIADFYQKLKKLS
jgi:DNA-binding transcriptional regulator YhcF (GntR family)